jgi:hypothetical protein
MQPAYLPILMPPDYLPPCPGPLQSIQMELELNDLQTIISVMLIGGAAALALWCDFLKAKNERLREALAELRGRRAEALLRAPSVRQRARSGVARQEPAADEMILRKSNPSPKFHRPQADCDLG